MAVAERVQPDCTTQDAATYKAAIDAAAKVDGRIAGAFAPHAQSTPDMTVRINAGVIPQWLAAPLEIGAQSTPAITAPSAEPRHDIVYVDAKTGAVGVATGDEAAAPDDPALPAGKIAIARVTLATTTTAITNTLLDDLRASAFFGLGTAAQLDVDTDTNLTADSDSLLASQKAVRSFVVANATPQSVLDRLTFLELNLAINTLRDQIDGGWSVFKMVDGVADEFEDTTGIASNDGTYDATGDYIHNPGGTIDVVTAGLSISQTTGVISAGTLANLIDGSTASEVTFGNDATSRFEITLASAASVQQIRFYLTNNDSSRHVASRVYTYSGAWAQKGSEGANQTIGWHDFTFSAVAGTTKVAIEVDQSGGAQLHVSEIEAYVSSTPANITVVSAASSAVAGTTDNEARLVLLHQPVGSVTLNTDVTIEASRDNGTTWTAGTLVHEGAFDATTNILSSLVALTVQPAGTSMKWRFKTFNAKEQRLHGVWMQWR